MRSGGWTGLAAFASTLLAACSHATPRPAIEDVRRIRDVRVVAATEPPRLVPEPRGEGDAAQLELVGAELQDAFARAVIAAGADVGGVRFTLHPPDGERSSSLADGRAELVLAIDAVGLAGDRDADGPLAAYLTARARIPAPRQKPVQGFSWMRFTLADPEPRRAAEWLRDGGTPLREAFARLVARAAPRPLELLTQVPAGDRTAGVCGLAPARPEAGPGGEPPAETGAGPARIAWQPWEPEWPGGAVSYDVRIWRRAGGGEALALARDGLRATALDLGALEPGRYVWTVRGVLALPDGRTLRTQWSRSAGDAPCGPPIGGGWFPLAIGPPDAHNEPRTAREARPAPAGETAAAGEAVDGAAEDASPPAEPWPPAGWRRGTPLRVVDAGADPEIAYLAGNLPRGGWGRGAAWGALAGVGECMGGAGAAGPLAGLVLLGCAVVGAPVGAVAGGIDAAHDAKRAREKARVPAAVADAVERALLRATEGVQRAAAGFVRSPLGGGAAPAGELVVDVERAFFAGGRGSDPEMALRIEVTARVTLADGSTGARTLQLNGPGPLPASAWLADDAALVRGAVAAMVSDAAGRVARDLAGAPATVAGR